jgi:hypothetical protein
MALSKGAKLGGNGGSTSTIVRDSAPSDGAHTLQLLEITEAQVQKYGAPRGEMKDVWKMTFAIVSGERNWNRGEDIVEMIGPDGEPVEVEPTDYGKIVFLDVTPAITEGGTINGKDTSPSKLYNLIFALTGKYPTAADRKRFEDDPSALEALLVGQVTTGLLEIKTSGAGNRYAKLKSFKPYEQEKVKGRLQPRVQPFEPVYHPEIEADAVAANEIEEDTGKLLRGFHKLNAEGERELFSAKELAESHRRKYGRVLSAAGAAIAKAENADEEANAPF